jgi:hypothetical protein
VRRPLLSNTRTRENLVGIPADLFRLQITTLTPLVPRKELREYEERLLYPFGRPKEEPPQEGEPESRETKSISSPGSQETCGKAPRAPILNPTN